jgi:hypothetical protein
MADNLGDLANETAPLAAAKGGTGTTSVGAAVAGLVSSGEIVRRVGGSIVGLPVTALAAAGDPAAAVASHEAASDPHPGYALESALGNSSTKNVGTAAGTVAAGDDSRFTDARTPTDASVTAAKLADELWTAIWMGM